jgi:hypothetical protein
MALYVPGRYFDGLLAQSGAIMVWPDGRPLAGRLELDVRPLPGMRLALRLDGRRVRAGHVSLAVCSPGRWTIPFDADPQLIVAGRTVTGRMSVPRYVPDPDACS